MTASYSCSGSYPPDDRIKPADLANPDGDYVYDYQHLLDSLPEGFDENCMVQWWSSDGRYWGCSQEAKHVTFDPICRWRIDPEELKPKAPKYRPFTLVEAAGCLGRKVIDKEGESGTLRFVHADSWVNVMKEQAGPCMVMLNYLCENYTFEDGSPCGALIEEES